MKYHHAVGLSLLVVAFAGIASNASAEGLTRAQVRQQLIAAENSGMRFVTDGSYPEVSPAFEQQAAHTKQQPADDVGGAAEHSATSSRRGDDASHVGPHSLCTPYCGG
jgi:hypothetical protein